jgi:hypothetical protein
MANPTIASIATMATVKSATMIPRWRLRRP